MSTPDFDAAVGRAARALMGFRYFGADAPRNAIEAKWALLFEDDRNEYRNQARAALQASGWEEAAGIARETAADELCRTFVYETCTECLNCRARAWVAQYTPEGTQ